MFNQTTSLPRAKQVYKPLPEALEYLEYKQFTFKREMSSAVYEYREQISLRNSMIQKNIDELSRLILTERENLQSNWDPLREKLSESTNRLRSGAVSSVQYFTAVMNEEFDDFEAEIQAYEEFLRYIIADRVAAINLMRQEFLGSADRLDTQLRAEKAEQYQYFDSIERQIDTQLATYLAFINSEHDRKKVVFEQTREDIAAEWKILQGTVEKRYLAVKKTVAQITQDLQEQTRRREQGEQELVATFKQVVDNINETMLIAGLNWDTGALSANVE